MFKFLKEKIKQAVNKIVHRVETEVPSKEEIIDKPFQKSLEGKEKIEEIKKDDEIVKQIDELEKFDKEIGKKESFNFHIYGRETPMTSTAKTMVDLAYGGKK